MVTSRFIITDRQWAKMEPHCLGLKAHPGRTGMDARLFLEAVFWVARTGAHWRTVARPSAELWKLEHCLSPFPGLGTRRRI